MTDLYPWLVSLGAIASLLWLGLVEPGLGKSKDPISPIPRIDAGLVSMVAGLLGARFGFVLIHRNYFTYHMDEILKFWNGGLSWVGGALGALLGLMIYAAIKKQSFWQWLDIMAIPAVFLAFSAWFGCLLDGCTFGKQADFGFLTPLSPNNLGEQLHRWPVQGTGAILTLGSMLILNRLRFKELPTGIVGTLSLAMISGSNLLLSFFRGDQVPILNGFRSDGLASAILLIVVLSAFALRLKVSDQIH